MMRFFLRVLFPLSQASLYGAEVRESVVYQQSQVPEDRALTPPPRARIKESRLRLRLGQDLVPPPPRGDGEARRKDTRRGRIKIR